MSQCSLLWRQCSLLWRQWGVCMRGARIVLPRSRFLGVLRGRGCFRSHVKSCASEVACLRAAIGVWVRGV